jgi:DNA-binding IclR family transcriptional regulator
LVIELQKINSHFLNPMEENSSAGSNRESAPALRHAARILDFVGKESTAPTAADIARALGLAKSSTHGLIGVMVDLGMLSKTQSNRFRPGPTLMRWAGDFLAHTDLVGDFQQLLAENGELDNYAITLSLLEDIDVVYLACRNSKAPLGFTFRIGMHLPAAFTATGKAILSTMEDEHIVDLYNTRWPVAMTMRSVSDVERLIEEMDATRQRGYSIDDGQIREGMTCIGAAVCDHTGKAVAGIAVSMLETEGSAVTIDRVGVKLKQIATALSRRLGAY